MTNDVNTNEVNQQEEDYGDNLREIFLACPEDAMSPEFREFVTNTWPESEPDTPSPEVMIKLFKYLLEEQELGKGHVHESVFFVMSAIADASYNRSEISREELHELHVKNGMVLDESDTYVLAPK